MTAGFLAGFGWMLGILTAWLVMAFALCVPLAWIGLRANREKARVARAEAATRELANDRERTDRLRRDPSRGRA